MADVTIGFSDTAPMPANTVFSYNGVSFGSLVKTKIIEEPVTSSDNRTVKYSKLTISASGWVTATDAGYTTTYQLETIAIDDAGTNYVVNDVIEAIGGTSTVAVTLRVDSVNGVTGAVLTATVTSVGAYTVQPVNPVTFIGGSGNNFSANITWSVVSVVPIPLDALMLSIRQRLQVHGKQLKYVNKGYGVNLFVNGSPEVPGVSVRDVAMGPKAGKFTWWPLGGASAGCNGAGFNWEITICIAECAKFQILPDVFIEVSFTINYDVGEDGLVVITYHGNAQIPLSLRNDGRLDRNIDSEIQRIISTVPVGFLRKHSRQLSADRASCSFTIVDRQLEVAMPDDVVNIDMRQRVRQEKPYVPNWQCSITGTVRLSPTAVRDLAYKRFFSIAAQRMAFTLNHVAVTQGPQPGAQTIPPVIMLGTSEFDEDFFKNESRFTVNYRIIKSSSFVITQVSGLWNPIVLNGVWLPPNPIGRVISMNSSNASLAQNAQLFRGFAGASFSNDNEVIIDICAGPLQTDSQNRPIGRVAGQFGKGGNSTDREADNILQAIEPGNLQNAGLNQGLGQASFNSNQIPPESSWLEWECTAERNVDHREIRHKPLAGTVTEQTPSIDPLGESSPVEKDNSAPTLGWSTTANDLVQQTASPSLTLRLVGYGLRLGYRINPPKLISYGGGTATLKTERVMEVELASAGGISIYRTDWELTYIITGNVKNLPLPANPLLGTNGVA